VFVYLVDWQVWDVTSGLCVSTIDEQFAEISGLDINQSGDQLVIATKSNTNILLDLRMNRVLRRFRGHQNSTLHFVGVQFGPAPGFLTGGSEDGRALIWNIATGDVTQSLDGHEGAVYSTAWSDSQSMLATCSEDETVKLWEFKAGDAPAAAAGPTVIQA
jgi:WD40 repeat protein